MKLTKQGRQAAKCKAKQLNLRCLNWTTENVDLQLATLYLRVLSLEVSDIPLLVFIVITLLTTDDGDITDDMKEGDNNCDDEVTDILIRLLTTDDGDITDDMKEGDNNCDDEVTDILIRLLTTDDGDITDDMKEGDNNCDDEVADISRDENDEKCDVNNSDDDSDTDDGLLLI